MVMLKLPSFSLFFLSIIVITLHFVLHSWQFFFFLGGGGGGGWPYKVGVFFTGKFSHQKLLLVYSNNKMFVLFAKMASISL